MTRRRGTDLPHEEIFERLAYRIERDQGRAVSGEITEDAVW
jgi:hypothetical protein